MTHTNNGREFWLQVVPDNVTNVKEILHYVAEHAEIVGKYRIHSDSATITEAQAAELVEVKEIEEHGVVYIEYAPEDEYDYWCGCATGIKSFQSLLRSLNINQRVIILEKLC